MVLDAGLVILAYLIGSLSSAIIVCRLFGLPDPRTEGSGNPGATNVLRIATKRAAAIVLVGDMVKGIAAILIAKAFQVSVPTLALVGFAVFAGHLYPVFFSFRGGKGVATAFGVLAALSWQVGLATAITWLVVAVVFRISSVAALTAAVLAPAYIWVFLEHPAYLVMGIVMAALLIWRHRSNIQHLFSGEEKKIGER